MGGDEFALLLPHSALDHALEMARRILHRLDQPFDLHDQLIDLGASIGIAVGNMAHSSFKMLLIQADVAMYRAKETGEYIHVYDPSLDSLAGSRLQLSEHMTRKKHILIVEDDRAVADMLVMLLETEGYRVTWLDNAASMVDLLTSYEFVSHKPAPHLYRADAAYQYAYPDVILLDLLLPNMDSIEVLQDIACKVPVMPPVIVVSARSQRDIQAAASVIGAVRMVRKPFEINMLLDIIKQVLMENHAG
jgi:PleD family two-component response regulator